MARPVFVGIDVAYAKNKMLPICICEWDGTVPVPFQRRLFPKPPRGKGNKAALDPEERESFGNAVLLWLRDVCEENDLQVQRIAIDAPSDYCRPDRNRRASEAALDALGISCFATPTKQQFENKIEAARNHLDSGGKESEMPNANQIWMLIGFTLFQKLSQQYECIEVYPHATVRSIGCEGEHKSKEEGFNEQVDSLSMIMGIAPCNLKDHIKLMCFGDKHDKLDAYTSAWIAGMPPSCCSAHGEPPHDAIWIPNLDGLIGCGLAAVNQKNEGHMPISGGAEVIQFRREFSLNEAIQLKLGGYGDMDSKWSYFFEEGWLSVYRGSGRCWARLKLTSTPTGGHVEEAS